MHSDLTGVVVIFGAALLVAWLMRTIRAPAILGFLVAGAVIGRFGLDLIQQEKVHFFAELGLVLLLFTVGLELSPAPLLRMGTRLLAASSLQIASTAAVAAIALHALTGLSWSAALIAGIAVALSSTAIVLKHLSDRNETDTPLGTLTTGVLLIQDVAVILLLIVLPFLADGSTGDWSAILLKAGLAITGLVSVTILARFALPWLVTRVFRRGGRELTTLFAVVMACLGAWLADLAHWSWPLGSFIAGLLLAQTDLRHQFHAEVMPFRDVFNALFFISIGMLVDFDLFAQYWRPLVLAVTATLLIKTILTSASIRLAGWPIRLSIAAGLGLCTISEFGYVLAKEAVGLNMLPPSFMAILVAWIAGTMLVGAVFVPVAGPLGDGISRLIRLDRPATAAAATDANKRPALTGHVIIVGFGVNGRNLASVLKATGIPHSIVEMNPANVDEAQREGTHVVVGDAARLSILSAAGLGGARAVVIAIADQLATRRIVAQVHRDRPDVYILARTRYVSELDTLYRLGAEKVIPEEFETSIEIFAHVLKEFAVPDNVIEQQVALVRAGRYGMLRGRPADRTARKEWLQILEAAVTQTYMVFDASPACGRTIRELNLRARPGVLIVAVTRSGKPTTNPPPDFRLETGDVLVLVGTHKQLDDAKAAMDPPPPADAASPTDSASLTGAATLTDSAAPPP